MDAGKERQAEKAEQVDIFGRATIDPQGRQILYPSLPEIPSIALEPVDKAILEVHANSSPSGKLDSSIFRKWYWAPLGTGIGEPGMQVTDVDRDDRNEIVIAAGGSGFGPAYQWYILEWNGTHYVPEYTQLPYPNSIRALQVAQVDADLFQEIIVALANQIHVYDGRSHQVEAEYQTQVSNPTSLSVGDIDGDGTSEAVLCDASDLFVYSLQTGELEAVRYGFGGVATDLGQIDDDPALEVAIANEFFAGHILDGLTLDVEWGLSGGFGSTIRFANVDGDPGDELIFGFPWDEGLQAWRVPEGEFLWSVPVFNLAVVSSGDLDGDTIEEVIYGDAQWGDIHVLRGLTGDELWSVENPRHGTTNLATGDGDGDGIEEIYWGAGYTSTGPDYLFSTDVNEQTAVRESDDLVAPFLGLDHGDVDGDINREVLVGTFESDSGYGDGLYLLLDADSGQLEYTSEQPTGNNWTGLWKAKVANLDVDPQLEICVTTGITYAGRIACFDGLTHLEEWHFDIPSGIVFTSLEIADVDGDRDLDIVAGVQKETTGAPGLYVYAIEGTSGLLTWRTPDLGGGWANLALLRVGQVDLDPHIEVVVAAQASRVTIIDGSTGLPDLVTSDLDVTSLDLSRQSTPAEILIGTTAARILRLDPQSGETSDIAGPFSIAVAGLQAVDLNRDGHEDFVFGDAGILKIFDGESKEIIWESSFLGNDLGYFDSLVVSDFNHDGNWEILANTGSGVLLIGIGELEDSIFSDGFESGDTSAWSETALPQ